MLKVVLVVNDQNDIATKELVKGLAKLPKELKSRLKLFLTNEMEVVHSLTGLPSMLHCEQVGEEELDSFNGLVMVNVPQVDLIRLDEIASAKSFQLCLYVSVVGLVLNISFANYSSPGAYCTFKDLVLQPNSNIETATCWPENDASAAGVHCALQGLTAFEQRYSHGPSPGNQIQIDEIVIMTQKFVADNRRVANSVTGKADPVMIQRIAGLCTLQHPLLGSYAAEFILKGLQQDIDLNSLFLPGSQQLLFHVFDALESDSDLALHDLTENDHLADLVESKLSRLRRYISTNLNDR